MCKGPADNCVVHDKQPDSDDEEALDRRIAEALDCPCVEELKSGPCGELFVNTFTCYQKSRAEPKGCDCLDVSLAFADCLRKHPEVLEDLQSDKAGSSSSSLRLS